MNRKLKEKILEALSSVVPISVIVFILSISFVPIPIGMTVMFLVGAAMLIVGMGFFSLGADMAMIPIGESVGLQFFKIPKLWLIIIVCFLIGLMVTIAEPDLQVLAQQTPAVPNAVLIITVGIGVGIFLVLAVMRIFFRISFALMLLIFYALVFILAVFVPGDFVPVAFDSGGVTTGPITVPFIMALGVGLASARSAKEQQEDSFGLVALCSVGPILAVMIMCVTYDLGETSYNPIRVAEVVTTRDVAIQFAKWLPVYLKEVVIAILPISIFFVIFQLVYRRFSSRQLIRVTIGFLYTAIGLVLFLTGVNVGFIPVGHLLGYTVAGAKLNWTLIPLGGLIGYYIVAAEPAVHVLNKHVEEVSSGAVTRKAMYFSLSIGVAVSLSLSMFRILTGISVFWLLVPGYLVAIALTFFVPKMFTGIAFDSGGVASGPMTSTFLLPFAIGACEGVGGNVLTDAFGVVAMVAMTPLITIQLMGLIYARRVGKLMSKEAARAADTDEIVEYEGGASDA